MKIFNRTFIFPIRISRNHTIHTTNPDFKIVFRKTVFWILKFKMAGTMRTTTYVFCLKTEEKERQLSFCLRPDVTRYYWRQPLI